MARTKTTHRERTVAPARNLRPTPSGSIEEHILTVNKGEDIFRKIMEVATIEPGVVFVNATGGILSLATICHYGQEWEHSIYEGQLELVSMVGTFAPFKDGVLSGKKGRMNITLLCPDGELLSGRVEGPTIAASAVQIKLSCSSQDEL
ncbi:AT-hook motif nuclear-localized protein 1-like isoform X2 [Andrographis paniculata]|uniref:AT-hook motif nuclear-localized protein 1-like isoform X2 n=1 Tax=Andrographis paniculata TaxID=175694 RepID=UPI0021E92693|nr:AT-hook motif nuclear-localized protein 1-like isoform X2 [Andrographis paniculata]